jgi:predicted acyltransferase
MFWIIGGTAIAKGLGSALHLQPDSGWFQQFEHFAWQGLHFYDVIWPLFMFIVGVSMPFSFGKRRSQGVRESVLYTHAVKRP